MNATIGRLAERVIPGGSRITADVIFTGGTTIKARYAMLYRKGELADWTWQVDPRLAE